MSLTPVNAVEALRRLGEFDAVIDARSEDEFAHDHLPGAVNWPTLNNQERHDIGTMYKQVNPFEARKRGAALAARNIAAHIEREVLNQPRDWQPLAYCWRGGQRSGALALILGQIGFRVSLLEGGYRAFRAAMLQDLAQQVARLHFTVVCGPTGSGKTRLLQALAKQGAQVLDLEALARHRSSVLGALPGVPQPSQKRFDTLVWHSLSRFEAERPVFVESESKKVGNLALPDVLMRAMRDSPCLDLRLSDAERVRLLMQDYEHLVQDTDFFCERLKVLLPLRGHAVLARWLDLVQTGQLPQVVLELLTEHYDPAYRQSIQRNFVQFGSAQALAPRDGSVQALQDLAADLLQRSTDRFSGSDGLA